jgi:aspartyl-tRNA(Asn)/glutamyl-tRNA(Gln) amidotransferase subunit A
MKNYNTVAEIHDAFDRGEFSVVQWTQKTLEAAKTSQLNAYLHLDFDRALDQAKKADQLLASGQGRVPRTEFPLFGIPLAIKDNMAVRGQLTTCASKILEGYRAPYTATAVERLVSAGAICFGKTNLDEFAMGGSNENSAFGSVVHPTHSDRVPGGSSGGSAAAVGAGHCVAALGSDTGGSIRLPASYCGIVGLKPTYGRISRYGLVAFASSLDQIGPMTRTVEDAALLLDLMSGQDAADSTTAPLPATQAREALKKPWSWAGVRVGVPKEFYEPGMQPEVKEKIQAVLDEAVRAGAQVVSLNLEHLKHSVAVYYLVAVSEASSNLSRFDGVRFGVRPPSAMDAADLKTFYKKVRAQFGPEVKRRILLGTFALSAGYSDQYFQRAAQVRRLIQQDLLQALKEVDLILGPVSTTTAFRLGEKNQDPLQMYLNDLFTIPANLAGLPGLSVPCGKDQSGLPIGIQLMAGHFEEEKLLRAAQWIEQLGRSV